MIDVALLTQFVWENLQMAGSDISLVVWDKIKNAVGNTTFDKMQQYVTNQQADEFKQQLENILDSNQPLAEQLEQLRQTTNNQVTVNVSNVSNITNAHGDINIGVVKL